MTEDVRTHIIAQNVQQLIKSLIGADQAPDVYRTCEQFAWSQIRNHRYMSTSSHAVRRAIDGLVDRFHSESMADYGTTVRHLCTLLAEHRIWKNHYEVDAQWSVLDFLFAMTNQPIQNVRRNRIKMNQRRLAILAAVDLAVSSDECQLTVERNKAETDIDWVAWLKEDFLPPPSRSDDSDQSLSDWTDDSDVEDSSSGVQESESRTSLGLQAMADVYARAMDFTSDSRAFVPSSDGAIKRLPKSKSEFQITQPMPLTLKATPSQSAKWCKLPELSPLQPPQQQTRHFKSTPDPDELPRLVHSHWWREDLHVFVEQPTKDPLPNFAIAYAQYLKQNGFSLIDTRIPKTTTENCLLREIIFMFFKPTSCGYFEVRQNKISVRENVTISSVTADTLKDILEDEILPGMQSMLDLRRLISEHTLLTSPQPSTGTLECFAVALRDLIKPINKRLMDFERGLLDNESKLNTLIGFLRHMNKELAQLQELWSIAERVIVKAEQAPPHLRSAYLISQLYNQMQLETRHQKTSAALLLSALKLYCGIIDAWWRRASLEDWRQEFVVERTQLPAARDSICLRPLQQHDGDSQLVQQVLQCPLYQLLRDHALQSGETQELLASLNRLGNMLSSSNQLELQERLHNQLLSQVMQQLKRYRREDADADAEPTRSSKDEQSEQLDKQLEEEQKEQQLLEAEVSATVRNKRLLSILTRQRPSESWPESPTPAAFNVCQLLDYLSSCSEMQLPLQDVVLRVLGQILEQRRCFANAYVMRLYREELQVGAHVSFLRHMLLLEADYLLYPFYTRLFRQIESGEHWAKSASLTMELCDIVEPLYSSAMATQLHIELISQLRSQTNKVYEAIDAIELVYDMEPPLQRIISAQSMTQYNGICRLMLKVKWAAWKLENLKFIRRSASRDPYAPLDLLGLTVRRLEILRFWLMYLVNSLHTHLCTHVLQAIGEQFAKQLPKCSNTKELASLHNEYIEVLAKHCLLTPDFASFRSALEQLFHLVFVLDMEWSSCCTYLNESHALSLDTSSSDASTSGKSNSSSSNALEYLALNQVVEIEQTYIRCHQMLAQILHSLVYKYDHSFLNALEEALNTSVPY